MADWEARAAAAKKSRLAGVRLAVDVQHAYRAHKPRDRGSVYTLADGTHLTEVDLASQYAAALVERLREFGAEVLTNDARTGKLEGYYSERQREAERFGALAYLACHVNASRGGYALMEYPAGGAGSALAFQLNHALVAAFPGVFTTAQEKPLSNPGGKEPTARGWACIGYFPLSRAAVLLEPFFGDSPKHQAAFAAPAQLRALGYALADGVANWFARVSPA